MTKRVLLQLVFVTLSVGAFAQSYREKYDSLDVARIEVLYDLTFREDSLRLDMARKERMILLIGSKMSSFQSYNEYRVAPIEFQKRQEGTYYEWFNSKEASGYNSRFFYQVYKDFSKGKVSFYGPVFLTGKFFYEDGLCAFDWEIMDDTLRIEDYLCQKAVCHYGGRTWVAWFTDELPFNDGPWKFCGLPGLILKVADSREHYCFDFILVCPPDAGRCIERFNDVYTETTRKGFFKMEDDLRENIMSHFDERTSLEAQRRAYNTMKSRNNPIELDRK